MPTLLTKGWDLVAVASQATLNTLLNTAVDDGLLPATISETVPLGTGGTTITIDLDPANPPTVNLNPTNAPGESSLVMLTLPFASGTISSQQDGAPSSISAGSFVVETEIAYVNLDFSGGTNETLALDFTSSSAVYSVSVTGLPSFWEDVVTAAIEQWMQKLQPGAISLGTVVVPAVVAPLAPVGDSMFAIQLGETPDDNTLLLLMTTSTGTAPSGSTGVDFSDIGPLLEPGQPSALYISNRVLMEEIIVPGMCASMSIPANEFSSSGSPTTPYISTFSGNVSISGEDDPDLEGLTLSVNSSNQVQGSYDVNAHPVFNAGSTYYVKVTGDIYVEPTLDTATQAISFATTSNSGSGALEASALGWAIIVAAIIATFGTVSVFIAGVVLVVVPLVVALLKFPVNMQSIDASISNSLGSFAWPLQKSYPLSSITVPGDLVIVGDPTLPS